MISKRIVGANLYLGAPKGWEPEKDGKATAEDFFRALKLEGVEIIE